MTMIVRDSWTGEMNGAGFNVGLGAVQYSTDPRYWLQQLHALAISLYQAQQRAMDALNRGDSAQAYAELGTVKRLRSAFADVRDKFLAAAEAVDPTALAATDRVLLASGEWVSKFMSALPGALAAPFKAVVDATGQIGTAAGGAIFKMSLPLVATGLLLVFFLMQAEKTRTVRAGLKYV